MAKFNANSLSYDQKLPPFLAALHGQAAAARGSGPDPILAGRRRAAKPRSASEEAENAPLVLDDRGEVVAGVTFGRDGGIVGREEKEGGEAEEEEEETPKKEGEADRTPTAQVGVGAGKKRRTGRTIGGDDEDANEDNEDDTRSDRKKRRRRDGDEEASRKEGKRAGDHDADRTKRRDKEGKPKEGKLKEGKPKERSKKKAKTVALSFANDEEEDDG